LHKPLRDGLDVGLVLEQKFVGQLASGLHEGIAVFFEPLGQSTEFVEVVAPGPIRRRAAKLLRLVACEATGDLLDEG
jgi:hypothetical protein